MTLEFAHKDKDTERGLPVQVLDLSTAISERAPARINLEMMDTTTLDGRDKQFADWLKASRRVMYDWGRAEFYVSDIPFVIDRAAKTITPTPAEKHWIGIDQDELRRIAGQAWIGGWSPIAADAVLTLLNSGVDVEIINSEKYGPSDPVQFVQHLRSSFNLPPPSPK